MARPDTASPIIAYCDKGKPIFGYNSDGIPVCYSKLAGQPGKRCGSVARMPNGRCRIHRGSASKGAQHVNFKTGLFSRYLNNEAVETLLEAVQDPKYLDMQEEIALNLLGIEAIMKGLDDGWDSETFKRIRQLTTQLESYMFSSFVQDMEEEMRKKKINTFSIQKISGIVEELSKHVLRADAQLKVHRELDEALARRSKLIEVDFKRVQHEKNHMPAEQVFGLFRLIIEKVKKCFSRDKNALMVFAYEMDQLAGSGAAGQLALGGRTGVTGMVDPRSLAGDSVRNQIDAVEQFAEDDDEDEVAIDETDPDAVRKYFKDKSEITYQGVKISPLPTKQEEAAAASFNFRHMKKKKS